MNGHPNGLLQRQMITWPFHVTLDKNHKHMKKSILYFTLLSVSFIMSCASVKTAKVITPEGDWAYTIEGTPQGNFEGVMTISKSGDGFSGQLNSTEGTLPFNTLSYSKEENKITATFNYADMPVTLTGVILENQMTGKVSTSGYEFPLKATRK